jgi:hypothetical protein
VTTTLAEPVADTLPLTFPQASAFLRSSTNTSPNSSTDDTPNSAQELADLREYPGEIRTRDFIKSHAAKLSKYAIETGYDSRTGTYRHAPLEAWNGPRGSQRLYQEVMFGDSVPLESFQGSRIDALEWMRDEGLVGVADDGTVQPLSDSKGVKRRTYPGADRSDSKAKIGHYLGDRGVGLVLAAMTNLMRHTPKSRIKRRKLAAAERHGGMSLPVYDIATEANSIKAKRPDLDSYRFLSVSTVRAIVKGLLLGGSLIEAEPPKAVRMNRSWRTFPRVFGRPGETAESPPDYDLFWAAKEEAS